MCIHMRMYLFKAKNLHPGLCKHAWGISRTCKLHRGNYVLNFSTAGFRWFRSILEKNIIMNAERKKGFQPNFISTPLTPPIFIGFNDSSTRSIHVLPHFRLMDLFKVPPHSTNQSNMARRFPIYPCFLTLF